MAEQPGEGSGVAMTDMERATAAAILAEQINRIAEAKRKGDDDWWYIADESVEVVVGGVTWEVWLSRKWMAFGRTKKGDLTATVGPAELGADEIVRRLATLELDELTLEPTPQGMEGAGRPIDGIDWGDLAVSLRTVLVCLCFPDGDAGLRSEVAALLRSVEARACSSSELRNERAVRAQRILAGSVDRG
jgi:hypothetical protein